MKFTTFQIIILVLFCFLLVVPVTSFAQSQQKGLEIPFHPEPFILSGEWKGKAVLAELFSGSECGPCVSSDLAFDGLLEAYDSKYLVVLEYHLPIPGPDPMMNPATSQRQKFYGVVATPTTFFDGLNKHRGGGAISATKRKYDQYVSSVDPLLTRTPQAQLQLSAVLKGDIVKVTWSSDDNIEAVNYNFALVQKEEKYGGSNGILMHKMVVRDFKSIDSKAATKPEVTFDIPEAEEAAKKHLQDYERRINIKFKELHYKIDRSQLKVVFFVQDKDFQIVYNVVVSDVVAK